MSETVKSALPPETWAGPFPSWRTATRYDEIGFDLRGGSLNVTASDKAIPNRVLTCRIADPDARHALAALALRDQPFGFSWDDVDALREIGRTGEWGDVVTTPYESLADRIAALLPPREIPE